eukprot:gene2551-3455_t
MPSTTNPTPAESSTFVHYKAKLLAEGYNMSKFDDTQAKIDQVITNVGKHYEVFTLGLSLTHNTDSTVAITQPKLLKKLFALYPTPSAPYNFQDHKRPHPPIPTSPPILLYLTKSRPDIMHGCHL